MVMKRIGLRALGLACAFGLLTVFAALPAAAMDARQGQSVSIPAGQTVHDDVYLAGTNIDVAGTVDGNLVAAGGSINISGVVTRDLVVFGSQVTITGTVDGSVRVMSGTTTLSGPVKGDALLAGGSVTVNPSGTIGRDIAIGAGTAAVNSTVARNAYLGGGDISIGGPIGGDVRASVNHLKLDPGAAITGRLTYSADQAATIAPEATTTGGIERTAQPQATRPTAASQAFGAIRGFVGILAFGLILLFVFPGFSRTAAPTLTRRPWASLGIGVSLLFGIPLLAVFAFILGLIVGGWWISLLLVALYLAAMAAGYVLGGYTLGWWSLHLLGREAPSRVLSLLLGLVILWVLGLVPLAGGIIGFAAVLFGLGALGVATFTSRFGGGGQVTVPVAGPVPPLPSRPAPIPA